MRKTLKPCPTCKVDICDFLKTAQANREMVAVIKKLQESVERAKAEAAKGGDDAEGEEGEWAVNGRCAGAMGGGGRGEGLWL